jgi:hypothetical protein
VSKEEILETLPGIHEPGDDDPFRNFPGRAHASPLAARLARAAFHWQIQPVDAVRALSLHGHRFTVDSVVEWMMGHRTLAPWEARSLSRLVRRLEHPESEEHVRGWWRTVREYQAWELAAYERREARRTGQQMKGSAKSFDGASALSMSQPTTILTVPSNNKEAQT